MNEPKTMRSIWQQVVEEIRQSYADGRAERYLDPLEPVAYSGGVLTLAAPNEQLRNYIALRWDRLLRLTLFHYAGREIVICYVTKEGRA